MMRSRMALNEPQLAAEALRTGLAALPEGVTWPMVHGVAWVAGIGFTMSLFIASLAFGSGALFGSARIGIMAGSACGAGIGVFLVRRALRVTPRTGELELS